MSEYTIFSNVEVYDKFCFTFVAYPISKYRVIDVSLEKPIIIESLQSLKNLKKRAALTILDTFTNEQIEIDVNILYNVFKNQIDLDYDVTNHDDLSLVCWPDMIEF